MQGFARGSFFGAVLEGEMRTFLGLIGLAAASSVAREAPLRTSNTTPLAAEVTGGVSLWFGTPALEDENSQQAVLDGKGEPAFESLRDLGEQVLGLLHGLCGQGCGELVVSRLPSISQCELG